MPLLQVEGDGLATGVVTVAVELLADRDDLLLDLDRRLLWASVRAA